MYNYIGKSKFLNRKDFVKMKLRKAESNEVEICYQCIEDARAYHKSLALNNGILITLPGRQLLKISPKVLDTHLLMSKELLGTVVL